MCSYIYPMIKRIFNIPGGFILLFSLLLPGNNLLLPAAVEPGCPFIKNYTPREYNSHFQNWAIIQDQRGIMYFGNTFGVLEFDGYYWRLIKVANHSAVRSLAIDSRGSVYVGAIGEFGFLKPSTAGNLEYVSLLGLLPPSERDFYDIWSTHATSSGIYFKTGNRVFRYYQGKLEIIRVLSSPFGSFVDGRVFIHHNGIYILDGNKPRLLPHTDSLTRQKTGLLFVLPYAGHMVLIATEKSGFYLYDLNPFLEAAGRTPTAVLKKFPTDIDKILQKSQLYSCKPMGREGYAFATLKGGIILMDRTGKFTRAIDKSLGLQRNRVNEIYLDRCQNLWAALSSGISYIELSSPLTRLAETTGLEDIVLSIARHKGKLYVGTMNGLFCHSPSDRQRPGSYTPSFQPVKNIDKSCWDLVSTPGGLFAGGNFGVVRVNDPASPTFYVKEMVYCLGQSKKFPGCIFLGLRNGLSVMQIKPAVNYMDRYDFKGVKGTIRGIVSDNQGDLWLATQYDGIIYLKFLAEDLSRYKVYSIGTGQGLPDMDWNKIYMFNNQVIAATREGIYKAEFTVDPGFDAASIRFVPENTFGKIFHQHSIPVFSLFFAGADSSRGSIWVNSGLGFGVLSRSLDGVYHWEVSPFQELDGDVQHCLIEADKTAWIGTTNGLFRFDAARKKDYHLKYRVLIRRVICGDGSVIYNGAGQPAPPPVFPYRDNSIAFEYSAAFYEHVEANRFQYMLENREKEWSNWTAGTRKEYTNLPEGKYCFKVKAKNIFDHESEPVLYRFSISPPWHRTTWAYIGGAALLLLVVISALWFHFYRVKQAVMEERKKYEKTALSPEKSQEILEKLQVAMNGNKPFLDPELTMKKLAKDLEVSEHHLSMVINDRLNQNFYEFINRYRIEEAKRILVDSWYKHTSILEIAYEVGFNSKATFNRAFKKYTALTPLMYRKKKKNS
jgi:AraC-like DNA-binding protein